MPSLLRVPAADRVTLLNRCLRQIAERESAVRAWAELAPREPIQPGQPGQPRQPGPLSGIPFGAKDNYETEGLKTEYGSPAYRGRVGEKDASLIALLRRLGAILLGKTHTTAFAYFDPAPTRNPHNPAHTPGGSSSGSAAAVAAGMAAFALGTQTVGSVIRPASFCGVVGFKPTFGLVSLEGVLPFAPSLDTAGFFTQTAADMHWLWAQLGFERAESALPSESTRFGFARMDPEPEMERAFANTLAGLQAAGLDVAPVDLPAGFERLRTAVATVLAYEASRTHRERWEEHGARLGAKFSQLIERGMAIPDSEYTEALACFAGMRQRMQPIFAEYPVILSPAAPGPAPLGLESTGDPRMNAPWTALGVPVVTVPMNTGHELPLGLQLASSWNSESLLLDAAAAIEAALTRFRE